MKLRSSYEYLNLNKDDRESEVNIQQNASYQHAGVVSKPIVKPSQPLLWHTEFEYFTRMPIELRDAVWKLVLDDIPGRTLLFNHQPQTSIQAEKSSFPRISHHRLNPLSSTCLESRRVWMKTLTRVDGNLTRPLVDEHKADFFLDRAPTYIDLSKDPIVIHCYRNINSIEHLPAVLGTERTNQLTSICKMERETYKATPKDIVKVFETLPSLNTFNIFIIDSRAKGLPTISMAQVHVWLNDEHVAREWILEVVPGTEDFETDHSIHGVSSLTRIFDDAWKTYRESTEKDGSKLQRVKPKLQFVTLSHLIVKSFDPLYEISAGTGYSYVRSDRKRQFFPRQRNV
ncbi:hypothetical protein BJ875DRAFT_444159 [Amylocarpus encephaloides]|uniref:2EXR domain-containing protein n=1 Tax=Amylocarpus encephaloides TaxID=45428 RepID=A0A9P7YE51_9HELO|nr:hypothetical protein BJ875DRAFT_444159 [Amylocarpus encephaloides]